MQSSGQAALEPSEQSKTGSPVPDPPDTVWIPPEKAEKILSGGAALAQDYLHPEQTTLKQMTSGQDVPAADQADQDTAQADQTDQDMTPPDQADQDEAPADRTDQDTAQADQAGQDEAPADRTDQDTAQADQTDQDDIPAYRRNPRKNRKKKAMGKILFSLLVLLVIAYLGGRYYFQNHFLPNTIVDGTDLGFHSLARAEDIMTRRLEASTLELIETDENEYLKGKDAGLHYVSFDKVEEILKKQDSPNWFLLLGGRTDYGSIQTAVDPETLSTALDRLHCMNPAVPKKPENAEIYYDTDKHKYMIQSETFGNIVNNETFLHGVTDAFVNRSPSFNLQDQTYFIQADIRKDNKKLVAARKKMNTWLKGIVKYEDGDLKLKLSRDEISSFIKWTDKYKVKIKKKDVEAFVEEKVAKTFNSLEGDIPEGLTAWKVDVKEETDALIKDIKGGTKVTRTPVYANRGLEEDEYNLGSTYIDVSIPRQEMWYVENRKVVFTSDIVTGNLSTGHGTTTGIYHIAYKQRDHMMVKYHSFVHYWMPYNTAVGIGFHDASWRSSFGGEIYRYDGSHGCINMPPPKAEELFQMISAGTTVYVHE